MEVVSIYEFKLHLFTPFFTQYRRNEWFKYYGSCYAHVIFKSLITGRSTKDYHALVHFCFKLTATIVITATNVTIANAVKNIIIARLSVLSGLWPMIVEEA